MSSIEAKDLEIRNILNSKYSLQDQEVIRTFYHGKILSAIDQCLKMAEEQNFSVNSDYLYALANYANNEKDFYTFAKEIPVAINELSCPIECDAIFVPIGKELINTLLDLKM